MDIPPQSEILVGKNHIYAIGDLFTMPYRPVWWRRLVRSILLLPPITTRTYKVTSVSSSFIQYEEDK